MNRVQCTACKRQKFVSDFLKNGKTLKTCITCRSKRSATVDSVVKPEPVKIEPVKVDLMDKPVDKPVDKLADKPVDKPIIDPVSKPIIDLMVKPADKPTTSEKEIPVITIESKPMATPVGWRYLSGKWIRPGDERKLHEKLTRNMIREYHERAAFPVHKYLTRWIMIDIRDL